MVLQLAPEEPEAGPWRVESLSTVVSAVTRRAPDRSSSGRPAVLAVDGRSNNGKTTVAARISEMVPGAVVIHTDDIAWEHSRFGWTGLLIDGVLVPAHQGQAVSYRPPRWDEHGRKGSIEVPAGCPLLIIEGDGAGRREVAHLIDTLIWVQADEREAARRSTARAADPPAADLANKAIDGVPFDEEGWMAEEIPFNAAQRTWERADIIVCGTPEIPHDPDTEIVIAPPPNQLDALKLSVRLFRHLGGEPVGVLFQLHQISMASGLRLADGTDVVVKARHDDGRAVPCAAVQTWLAERGFPYTRPLTPTARCYRVTRRMWPCATRRCSRG